MNDITFIGAYPVDIPKDEYNLYVTSRKDAASVVRKELDSLALVELEVMYATSDFDLTFIKQPHTEFVPYDETYFDVTSLKELLCFTTPTVECFRVAFYLHHFDADQPLETPWGPIRCTALQALPKHLRNKKYIYWT